MRLLHPFMPFLTEEMWQVLHHYDSSLKEGSIMNAEFPSVDDCLSQLQSETDVLNEMDVVLSVLHSFRSLKSVHNDQFANLSEEAPVVISTNDSEMEELFSFKLETLKFHFRLENVGVVSGESRPHGYIFKPCTPGVDIGIPITDKAAAQKDIARFSKKVSKYEKQIAGVSRAISVPDYKEKASPEVQEMHRYAFDGFVVIYCVPVMHHFFL